jgi:hypothetical protein
MKMSAEMNTHETLSSRRLVPGLALVLIGALALAANLTDYEWVKMLFLPALGLIFIVWGAVERSGGLLIPGGILTGIGLGVVLLAGPLGGVESEANGGIFFLSLAMGFLLISLLTAIFTGKVQWWPVIPAAFLALFGAALLLGGASLEALALVGQGWPIILIIIGLYLLLWRRGLAK